MTLIQIDRSGQTNMTAIWAMSWDYGTGSTILFFLRKLIIQTRMCSHPAGCLIFGQTLRPLPYFMCANSKGSGETARICRLTRAFAGHLCYKYHNFMSWLIWAPSSEFMSSSIPSWQTLTAHVQLFRGARDLAFFLKVPLHSLLVWASSGGCGETARMRRLAWTFAARIGDKYQIHLAGLI